MSGRSSGFMARLGGGSDSLGAVHGQDRYWVTSKIPARRLVTS
jgi:hypothetical protein